MSWLVAVVVVVDALLLFPILEALAARVRLNIRKVTGPYRATKSLSAKQLRLWYRFKWALLVVPVGFAVTSPFAPGSINDAMTWLSVSVLVIVVWILAYFYAPPEAEALALAAEDKRAEIN